MNIEALRAGLDPMWGVRREEPKPSPPGVPEEGAAAAEEGGRELTIEELEARMLRLGFRRVG